MKTFLSYGMGVESTAILLRWLAEPASRWFPLDDLAVITAQTGDEMPDTRQLVEAHVLPRLRAAGVRYVQVARRGPRAEDGWAVLDDTTAPERLWTEGLWRLSDEMRLAGTLPQCQSRRCSIKFKGWPLDQLIAHVLGGTVRSVQGTNVIDVSGPFWHVIGFNADEQGRVERDRGCGGPMRRSRYPLLEWNWDRAACLEYIRLVTGVEWRKSCCLACCFPNGNAEILARYRQFPEVAADALLLELVALALNPLTTLYRDRTLRSVIEQDGNAEALRLLHERLEASDWAVYRVRRLMTRKGGGDRSVRVELKGERADVYAAMVSAGVPVEVGEDGVTLRAYLRRRETGVCPTSEEFLVAAPALAESKEKAGFDEAWRRVPLRLVA